MALVRAQTQDTAILHLRSKILIFVSCCNTLDRAVQPASSILLSLWKATVIVAASRDTRALSNFSEGLFTYSSKVPAYKKQTPCKFFWIKSYFKLQSGSSLITMSKICLASWIATHLCELIGRLSTGSTGYNSFEFKLFKEEQKIINFSVHWQFLSEAVGKDITRMS